MCHTDSSTSNISIACDIDDEIVDVLVYSYSNLESTHLVGGVPIMFVDTV